VGNQPNNLALEGNHMLINTQKATKKKDKGSPDAAFPALVKNQRPNQVHAGPVPAYSYIEPSVPTVLPN